MKTTDFRIGNYVQHIPTKTLCRVSELTGEASCISADEVERYGHTIRRDLEPILLREKWFGLLGFENYFTSDPQDRGAGRCFNIGNFKVYMPNEDYYRFIYNINDEETVELEYVHQLQNLYFVIKGRELKL